MAPHLKERRATARYSDRCRRATSVDQEGRGELFAPKPGRSLRCGLGGGSRDREPAEGAFFGYAIAQACWDAGVPRAYRHDANGNLATQGASSYGFDAENRLYVAASLGGRKGVVRFGPDRKPELFLSGPGIVGMAFTPSRSMVVSTTNALYRVDVRIKGRLLA